MQSVASHPSAVELLTALDFWEWYPYWLKDCRVAIALLSKAKGQTHLCVSDKARPMMPVTFRRVGYTSAGKPAMLGWELVLPAPMKRTDLIHGFAEIGIVEDTSDRVSMITPAQCFRSSDQSDQIEEIHISERALLELHEQAERILCLELERRGMDSSALVVSGRVCRHVCDLAVDRQCEGGEPVWPHWPQAVRERIGSLCPTDLGAVVQAERYLIRLRTQLKLEVEGHHSKEHKDPLPAATAAADGNNWWHDPAEQRPAEYRYGPITGTKAEISTWLGEKKTKTPRWLEQKAKSRVVWVIRQNETSWEVWFKDQTVYETADRKRKFG